METITVALAERSYPIYIGTGLLDNAELYLPHLPQKKAAIITNETVAPLYLDRVANALRAAGVEIVPIVVPDGEKHKNWQTLNSVFDALLANHCERKTTVIALGGGVVGDLAGFAAASYLRGVPFIQVPTTLLAQVDSSVGGKTGINHALGKNMIGAFYQPRAVIADTGTLNTLPDRELSAGLAEVIKYGLIRDLPFFEWLEANVEKLLAREHSALAYAIKRSCENKAAVVAADERETGERALLNFGHTFGHAIETATNYEKWLHGEAVAIGTVMAARLSGTLGMIEPSAVARITALLKQSGNPSTSCGISGEQLLPLMYSDKKIENGQLRLVLLKGIGQALVQNRVSERAVLSVLNFGH
jgi:3-dehydroquinate synthase